MASPGEPFAEAQAPLAGLAEPEPAACSEPMLDRIPVAQDGLLNGLAINGGQCVGLSR